MSLSRRATPVHLDNPLRSYDLYLVAPKRKSRPAADTTRPYTPPQLARFRRRIREAVRWAKSNNLDVMPSCWSLGTIYGLKSCGQLGFCCPLGAVVLRQPPAAMSPDKWTCLAASKNLGATEDFVTGFIEGYEGQFLKPGLNPHHMQGYRMGRQFRNALANRRNK